MSSGDDPDLSPRPTPKPVPKGPGVPGDPNDNCNIVETTNLSSPDRNVLATLRVRDVLKVRYEAGPPKRLLADDAAGNIAGAITSTKSPQIMLCIEGGRGYVAEVDRLQGAICEVTIRPA